jgi:hypothetical protein
MPTPRKRASRSAAGMTPLSALRHRKLPERPGDMRRVTATGQKNPQNNGTTYNAQGTPKRRSSARKKR